MSDVTHVIQITIEKLGPYGPLAAGVWYGLSKKSGLTVQDFIVGNTYNVVLWTSDSGKKYINKVVNNAQSVNGAESVASPAQQAESKQQPKATWADNDKSKNKRILVQGVYQAVAHAAIHYGEKQNYVDTVAELAEGLLGKMTEKHGELWK